MTEGKEIIGRTVGLEPAERGRGTLPPPPLSLDDNLRWVRDALALLNGQGFQESIHTIDRSFRWSQADRLDTARQVVRLTGHISHPSLDALRARVPQ